jgi:hypothetical protein
MGQADSYPEDNAEQDNNQCNGTKSDKKLAHLIRICGFLMQTDLLVLEEVIGEMVKRGVFEFFSWLKE